jgi:hypothetical protein
MPIWGWIVIGAADGRTTEDLRRAMQHYRALFDDLVEEHVPAGAAAPREREPVSR